MTLGETAVAGAGLSAGTGDATEQLAMRQLRHQSKNALQRLLCQVAGFAGQQHDRAARALADDLERRIVLSASLSDALFGMTHAPDPLAVRLEALCRAVVGLLSDGDQLLAVSVEVDSGVPAAADDVLVRIAHELVGNTIKHGMRLRMVGQIRVAVQVAHGQVVMTVSDDGWGFCGLPGRGEGLSIAHSLAERHDGVLLLRRDAEMTVATLSLPLAALARRQ